MKSLFLSLTLFASPLIAFANANDPIEAFRKSEAVMMKEAEVIANGHVLNAKPEAALLGGGCGFSGCDKAYLVTLGYSTKGPNPQTSVISAVVTISTYKAPVVELKSVEALFQ